MITALTQNWRSQKLIKRMAVNNREGSPNMANQMYTAYLKVKQKSKEEGHIFLARKSSSGIAKVIMLKILTDSNIRYY